jgi:DNA-binding winged helix-turn-helix (wHTH) protein
MSTCPCCRQPLPPGPRVLVHAEQRLIIRAGRLRRLSPRPFDLFGALYRAHPNLIGAERLWSALWGDLLECDWPENPDQAVRTLMFRLRPQLAPLGMSVANEPGLGYRLLIEPLGQRAPAPRRQVAA